VQEWIDFFLKNNCEMLVVTPPTERAHEISAVCKDFAKERVQVLAVMSLDTCDRWRAGLTWARQNAPKEDVMDWSSDFKPEQGAKNAALELAACVSDDDMIVGCIEATGTKKGVDDLATWPLLDHWFPEESARLKDSKITKPRSELIRLRADFVDTVLRQRWFPTEQTIAMLLNSLWGDHRIRAMALPAMEDEGRSLEVVQQPERMDLWMRYIWRARVKNWNPDDYLRRCETASKLVLKANRALIKLVLDGPSS
jgi:hypothetical protein